jgi:hypothetical protein
MTTETHAHKQHANSLPVILRCHLPVLCNAPHVLWITVYGGFQTQPRNDNSLSSNSWSGNSWSSNSLACNSSACNSCARNSAASCDIDNSQTKTHNKLNVTWPLSYQQMPRESDTANNIDSAVVPDITGKCTLVLSNRVSPPLQLCPNNMKSTCATSSSCLIVSPNPHFNFAPAT